MISKKDKILVTGASGLVGSNLILNLSNKGHEVLGIDSKNDLRIATNAYKLFDDFKPKIVFHLAAKVGGIHANSNFKSDFYSDNVLINTNVVNACIKSKVDYIFAMGKVVHTQKIRRKILFEKDFLDGIPKL